MPRKPIMPEIGNRYGRWIVLADGGRKVQKCGKQRIFAICRCNCGTVRNVSFASLKAGNSKSCGCLVIDATIKANTKHGLKKTALYGIYSGVSDRCNNPRSKDYRNYGARGIHMCSEWKGNPEAFIHWCLANGWEKGLQIDRINNDDGYTPLNCRFTTAKINCQNRRSSKVWIINEFSFNSSTEAASFFNVHPTTIAKWCQGYRRRGVQVNKRKRCFSYFKNPYKHEESSMNKGLILTRRSQEKIVIGDDIIITILNIKGKQCRLHIDAPKSVSVHREEIYQRIHGGEPEQPDKVAHEPEPA